MIQPCRQLAHKGPGAGRLQNLHDLSIAGMRRTQQQVLAQSPIEKARILRQQGHITAHVCRVDMGQRDIIKQHLACHGLLQARQRLQQGGLARPVAPKNGNAFTRLNVQLLDRQSGALTVVAEHRLCHVIAPLNQRPMNATAIRGVVHGQLHELIQPFG